MTLANLVSYIRWKGNVSSSSPWDNTSLLPVINIAKDDVSQAIAQVNPNYFGEVSTASTVATQQEYTKPSDLLLFKRLDVSYTDTNTGSYYPAKEVSLDDIKGYGEDYYAANQPTTQPLYRFDDTGLFLYPTPTTGQDGSTHLRLWYAPKRNDFTDLTSTSDIDTLTGIGFIFHELIGDMVVNQIKYKKGELTQQDVQTLNAKILDELVPGAFRKLSTNTSSLPSDVALQY